MPKMVPVKVKEHTFLFYCVTEKAKYHSLKKKKKEKCINYNNYNHKHEHVAIDFGYIENCLHLYALAPVIEI